MRLNLDVRMFYCGLFNRALDKAKSKTRFWQKIRNLFQSFLIPHWETCSGDRQ